MRQLRKVIRLATKIASERKLVMRLDKDCEDGSPSILLKEALRIEEAYGIETEPKRVELAKSKGITTFSMDMDGADLFFEDGFLDVVLCSELIKHLFSRDCLLGEACNVLKCGGYFILTTPNLASWHNRIAFLPSYQPDYAPANVINADVGTLPLKPPTFAGGHIQVMTFRTLTELLEFHNFKIEFLRGPRLMDFSLLSACLLLLHVAEKLASHFPSLVNGIIAVVKKG